MNDTTKKGGMNAFQGGLIGFGLCLVLFISGGIIFANSKDGKALLNLGKSIASDSKLNSQSQSYQQSAIKSLDGAIGTAQALTGLGEKSSGDIGSIEDIVTSIRKAGPVD